MPHCGAHAKPFAPFAATRTGVVNRAACFSFATAQVSGRKEQRCEKAKAKLHKRKEKQTIQSPYKIHDLSHSAIFFILVGPGEVLLRVGEGLCFCMFGIDV